MDAISLFCGAGGMDLGFMRAGHKILWANDRSLRACETYDRNLHLTPLCKDIHKIDKFPVSDIVIGCNPCQGFSSFGPRNPEDKRNYLYEEVVRCLRQTKPKFFVTENVKGLKTLYKGRFFELMLTDFDSAGYDVKWDLLNAKNYGVPQDRERIFIVGVRKDLEVEYCFPPKTHGPGLQSFVTLEDAIGDIPAPKKGEFWNENQYSFFYMSRNRRRSWNQVSYTIQASGRHAPLHPSCPPMQRVRKDEWRFTDIVDKYRRLSVKECARIQTFPDTYVFEGGLENQYIQVGNAVPPLLAQTVASAFSSLRRCSKASLQKSLGLIKAI